MYTDMLVTFSTDGLVHRADVWQREFPNGRQRRYHSARYTLELDRALSLPVALLVALTAALEAGRPPDWEIGR